MGNVAISNIKILIGQSRIYGRMSNFETTSKGFRSKNIRNIHWLHFGYKIL